MSIFALFFGSRDWKDREPIREALSLLPIGSTVIHGAAPGADSVAGWEAELMGFDVIPVPAYWDDLGDAAGPERNQRMLLMLLAARGWGQEIRAFAFHEDPKLGSGTRDMARRCQNAGIIVTIHVSSD